MFEQAMYGRRTRQNPVAMKVLCLVLLIILGALAGGCRDGETATSPTQSLPFTLNLPVGAQFAYNTWLLDQTYPQIPSVKTTTYWTVLSTGQKYQGMSGVTMVADSAGSGRDTLYLAASSSGDLYFYGYLARLTKRRLGYDIPPRWDLVAAFSLGKTGSWTVGSDDSLGLDIVYGSIVGASDYYSTVVDGVTEVFPTYRVDLTGSTLLCSLWFSSTPNTIVRLLDEPDYYNVGGQLVNGKLQELASVKTGAR